MVDGEADEPNVDTGGSEIELKLYPGFTAIVTTLLGGYGTGPIMGAEVLMQYLAGQKIESTGPMVAVFHHTPGMVPPNKQRLDLLWLLPPSAKAHRAQVPWIAVQEQPPQEVLAIGRLGLANLEETMALWEMLSSEASRLSLTPDGPIRRIFYEPRAMEDETEQWSEMQLPVRRLVS